MENLLLALSPVLVYLLTAGLKKFVPLLASLNKGGLRLIVAFLSLASSLASSALSGQELNVVSVETFADTFLTFLTSQGLYFFFPSKVKEELSPAPQG